MDRKKLQQFLERKIKYKRKMEGESNIKNIIKLLKNNFLFQVSLGSKELFHSNLIAWILEQKISTKHNSFILEKFLEHLFGDRSFLGKEEIINYFDILRESNNIDLIIKWQVGNEIWIALFENKVKSIPTLKQLKEYSDKGEGMVSRKLKFKKDTKTASHLPILIKGKYLLTMSTVDEPDIFKSENWINITYNLHILDFLRSISDLKFKKQEVRLLIRKYISFLENQIAILKYFGLISSEKISFLERPYDYYKKESIVSELRSIRLHDLVLKLIHHKIAKEVEIRLSEVGLQLRRSESEFTNSTGVTSVDIILEESFIIGIQLQGNQFRLYTIHKDAKINEQFALELWRNHLWFYDLSTQKALNGSGRRKSYFQSNGMKDKLGNNRSFCEYNQGIFLYLYKDLSLEEGTLSINKVVDLFVQYLSHLNSRKNELIAATKSKNLVFKNNCEN
jgi:hypothetical protein